MFGGRFSSTKDMRKLFAFKASDTFSPKILRLFLFTIEWKYLQFASKCIWKKNADNADRATRRSRL